MTDRTLLQLSKAVADKLTVTDALEQPAAVDHALIVSRYEELMEELRDDDLCYWPNGAIPLVVFTAVVDLVALHVAPSFGMTIAGVYEIENAEIPIKRRIRKRLNKAEGSGAEIKREYI